MQRGSVEVRREPEVRICGKAPAQGRLAMYVLASPSATCTCNFWHVLLVINLSALALGRGVSDKRDEVRAEAEHGTFVRAPTKGIWATDVLARPLGRKMLTSAMPSTYDTWLNTISARHASAAGMCSQPEAQCKSKKYPFEDCNPCYQDPSGFCTQLHRSYHPGKAIYAGHCLETLKRNPLRVAMSAKHGALTELNQPQGITLLYQ